FFLCFHALRALHSFPTRRSSDLLALLPLLTLLALLAALGTERAIEQLPLSAQKVRETLDGIVHRVLLLVLLALLTLLALTGPARSEEHTSELQSPCNLVCRLLLE